MGMTRRNCLAALLAPLLAVSIGAAQAQEKFITVSSTTSTE